MRHLIPISGKDSAATAIVQIAKEPDLEYEFFFNPTGSELPEVFEWIDKVGVYLGKPIIHVGDNLEEIIYEQKILPSFNTRFCTRLSKIVPMEDYIGADPAIVYYGIRADESRVGYQSMGRNNITPRYPLQEAGINLRGVWNLLSERNLLPPQFFWESVYKKVSIEMGLWAGLIEELLEPWEKAYLFAWRSRANCYHCFYQRRYEWVGLLEHYPELFWKAVEIEETVGGKGFYWNKDLPLRTLAQNADTYRAKRVKAIIKAILKRKDLGVIDDGEVDWLAATPCGLHCGK